MDKGANKFMEFMRNRIAKFVSSHKLKISISFVSALMISMILVHETIYNVYYIDFAEDEIRDFILSDSMYVKDTIMKEMPEIVDKYQVASEGLSLLLFKEKNKKMLDEENFGLEGRYRFISYSFTDRWRAERRYEEITQLHRAERKTWIPWRRCSYSAFYWNDDITGAYVYVWYNKNRLTVLVAENRESGQKIIKNMKKGRR